MGIQHFHPAVRAWFERQFVQATPIQDQAWPAIAQRQHTLIAAPTGSGKTLAAFLAAIDNLVRQGLEHGLDDATQVLYVSPLKALSNDIQKNLQQPLQGIRDVLFEQGLADVEIRTWVRSGDTTQAERARMRKLAPHIIVTTPESLYILLTSESGRRMLSTVHSVIVDEIHAIAGSKRGSHLSLSLERLAALCQQPLTRIGLSATQKPVEAMAQFLTGSASSSCTIVDSGHVRERDLAIEVPQSPLEAVMANEVWSEIYDRLAQLVAAHRTTLIFVNTRRLAERAARFLAERIGEEHVTAHHGSLAREHRLDAEQRLKNGELKALVATASLELGIDIGDVDLVCQLGSPRSIAALLQRVGRSGHAVGALPKGRLFPLTRDDLVECTAMLDSVRRGELDRIRMPQQPLDVLAQQIVAEVACREWDERALFDTLRRAWPYRDLTQKHYSAVVRMLAEGFSTRRGRRSAYLHRDAVNGQLRARRGALLIAVTNGGAIPDQFDSDVILSPEGIMIGSLNEDFAFESLPGDIFQLGNTSYRILKIEQGKVYVEDAHGQPPNIPFWFGEAPGRTDELSFAVSRLRVAVDQQLQQGDTALESWLQHELGLSHSAAQQLGHYLAAAKVALGVVPSQQHIVLERFFDQVGDMHLVLHAPFGSRLNRAWGLALRKRFCRKFNFELQAAALEDSLVLSLGPTHSFALEEVVQYLHPNTVRDVLTQAVLDAPMFATRWRWNASIALAVRRNRNGKRTPPQFQRMDAEDLMAVVFPDQLACQENITGQREIPEHPLVQQCLEDCLRDTMDIDELERVLRDINDGHIDIIVRDLNGPSPLAQEILNARPYAFLDDAPAEERRTLAVQARRFSNPADAAQLGSLDSGAIARVCREAWPDARDADELHDALVVLGFLSEAEGLAGPLPEPKIETETGSLFPDWQPLFQDLCEARRATTVSLPSGERFWVAAERLQQCLQVYPDASLQPVIAAVVEDDITPTADEALRELLRSRLEGLGPVTLSVLAQSLALPQADIEMALLQLEQEGFVVRGEFTAKASQEWCERRLLARIHRYTIKRLRSEIEPVAPADFMRFLFHWQQLLPERPEGVEALAKVLQQLEGYSISAAAWETDILPLRMQHYTHALLDQLCSAGRFVWLRLQPAKNEGKSSPVRNTPIVLIERSALGYWQRDQGQSQDNATTGLSAAAEQVHHILQQYGASFFVDLVQQTGLLRTQVEEALALLVARGLVSADSFGGLRALITPSNRRPGFARRHKRRTSLHSVDAAGRWALLRQRGSAEQGKHEVVQHIAWVLLRRYGVVFRKLLERENGLPPWRELLRVYHRLEARGEIRGGRFVQGFSGEQFAMPDAVATLRAQRKREKSGEQVVICAADPLNLVGIIVPGERVPALAGNRVLFHDGIPLAVQVAGDTRYLQELDAAAQWEVKNRLIKQHNAAYISAPHNSV